MLAFLCKSSNFTQRTGRKRLQICTQAPSFAYQLCFSTAPHQRSKSARKTKKLPSLDVWFDWNSNNLWVALVLGCVWVKNSPELENLSSGFLQTVGKLVCRERKINQIVNCPRLDLRPMRRIHVARQRKLAAGRHFSSFSVTRLHLPIITKRSGITTHSCIASIKIFFFDVSEGEERKSANLKAS